MQLFKPNCNCNKLNLRASRDQTQQSFMRFIENIFKKIKRCKVSKHDHKLHKKGVFYEATPFRWSMAITTMIAFS